MPKRIPCNVLLLSSYSLLFLYFLSISTSLYCLEATLCLFFVLLLCKAFILPLQKRQLMLLLLLMLIKRSIKDSSLSLPLLQNGLDDEDDDTEDDSFGYEGEEVVSVGVSVSGGDGATEDDLNEACSDLDLECETSEPPRHTSTEVFQRCQVAAIQIGYHNGHEEEEEDQLRDCIATQKVSDEREREIERAKERSLSICICQVLCVC